MVRPDPSALSPQSSQTEAVPSLGRSIPLHQKLSAFLQNQSKWQQEQDDLTVGTIILIIDQQLPCALWPVGMVTAVILGC